ncbi:MAG: CPBP family intramembrane metalloprotease, partial [Candidatus Marinimicrobia bacterium]|nr:CPBP family intramembrane metalloprotease [Candidatus Neomarinimicrobiota bacterium]
GLSPLDKGIWLGLLFFTGGLLILFDALDRLLIHWVDIPQEYLSLMESLKWSRLDQAFLMIFAVSCVAPFAEETFFRGMLLNSLEHAFHKPFVAVILAAFIFAFVHAMPWYFLQIVLLGIVFGLLSSGLRSVWPAIFCHGAYNFFSMILLNLEKEPTWYSIKDQVRNGWIIIAGFLLWRGIVRLQPWFSLPKPASQKSSES